MFVALSEAERQAFFRQNSACFIPGYTGHCPTLKFQYGTSYGTKTKEILQELRENKILQNAKKPYKEIDYGKNICTPIERQKGQYHPSAYFKTRNNNYIIGYTGFIPTLNFRYGKSYGRTADDSMEEFSLKQTRYLEEKMELERMRSCSAPKLTSIRNKDDIEFILREKEDSLTTKTREISPEFPPIAGYTGYIPKVKGNEESLSQRYNTVVKRSLTLLKEEKDHRKYNRSTNDKIRSILKIHNTYEPSDLTRRSTVMPPADYSFRHGQPD